MSDAKVICMAMPSGKVIVKFPTTWVQIQKGFPVGSFISDEWDETLHEFSDAKFSITRNGKFRARQSSNFYNHMITESRDGSLGFYRTRDTYSKGKWAETLLSKKIIL